LRVRNHQLIRRGQTHRALHDLFIEMQRTHIAIVKEERLAILRKGSSFFYAFRSKKIYGIN
jgi:hypothetical protein